MVLTLETSEVVDTPTVSIAGDAIAASGNVVPDSRIPTDATTDGPSRTPSPRTPRTVLWRFPISELTDAHGNVNPREYVRPVGFGSDRPLVDGRAPRSG